MNCPMCGQDYRSICISNSDENILHPCPKCDEIAAYIHWKEKKKLEIYTRALNKLAYPENGEGNSIALEALLEAEW